MYELALFAGAGGGLLASRLLGWRTICAVEVEPYCREVLLRRQRDGVLDLFPVWDDIRTFDGRPWRGIVDVVSAGFPCQPFSVAGRGRGDVDDRNLWPEVVRVARDVGPPFLFLENVPGLLSSGYAGTVFGDLAASGYEFRYITLSASDIGAPQNRERVWIVAYSNEVKGWVYEKRIQATNKVDTGGVDQDAPNTGSRGLLEPKVEYRRGAKIGYWASEPSVGRVVDGMANRMDRLRAIGNGQVPRVAEIAWRMMMEGQGKILGVGKKLLKIWGVRCPHRGYP